MRGVVGFAINWQQQDQCGEYDMRLRHERDERVRDIFITHAFSK